MKLVVKNDTYLVIGTGTQKSRVKPRPFCYINPKIETRPIPETRYSKPKNPRFFHVSEFLSEFPIFYSRNSKRVLEAKHLDVK